MLTATTKYQSTEPRSDCVCFGTRNAPLMRGEEQVGAMPLLRPHFLDHVGALEGKLVVHGQITEDGILWDDDQDR